MSLLTSSNDFHKANEKRFSSRGMIKYFPLVVAVVRIAYTYILHRIQFANAKQQVERKSRDAE